MRKPSKAEQQYMNRVASVGCLPCRNKLMVWTERCLHHIRTGQGRKKASHYLVLPLCPAHHQYGDGTAKYQGEIGYHYSPSEFEAEHGTELELLGQLRELLGGEVVGI